MKVEIKSQDQAKHDWKRGDLFSYGTDGLFVVNSITGDGGIYCTVIVPRNSPVATPTGSPTSFSNTYNLRKVTKLDVTVE